jgi:hypothetical protein
MPATNPYYQDQFTGQPGQNAKAEQVNSEFQGVQSGFDGVNGDILRAIKGAIGETLNDLPAAVSRAGLWLKFDAEGQPTLATTPLNVRGMWAASTAYNVGDAFNAEPNGTLYYVMTAYTSGATFGATDLANTQKIVDLTGLFFTTPVVVTGTATVAAQAGKNYGCDSSGGNITINLPTATLGDSPVSLTYLAGAASTVTVNAAAGQHINGVTQTQLVMDLTGFSTSLQYWGPSYGWRVRTMG